MINGLSELLTNPMSFLLGNTIMGGGVRTEKQKDGSFFYLKGGGSIDLPYKTSFEIYRAIPHLQSIVNKRLAFFSNVRFKVVRPGKPGEEDVILYDHHLVDVLNDPNSFQTWKSFLWMVGLYKLIGGVAYIYPGFGLVRNPLGLAYLKPVEYETKDVEENTSNNPMHTDNIDDLINKITFWLKNGKSVEYKASELIDFKDSNYSYTDDINRVTTGMLFIENLYKSLVNRGILMDAQGGIGIISGNQKDSGMSVPLRRSEKKRISANLNDYGLGRNKKPVIITDVPLRWTPMTFPTRELMLFEEEVADFNGLCDLFEMARELFVGDAAYASTRAQAEEDTYSNTIIPEWTDLFKLLNKALGTKKAGIRIDMDYSHIGCLQKDVSKDLTNQKLKQDILMAELEKNIIDIESYRKQMGYETAKA